VPFWNSSKLEPSKQNRFRVVFTPSLDHQTTLLLLNQEANKQQKKGVSLPPESEIQENTKAHLWNTNFEATTQEDYWWWAKACNLPSFEIAMSEYQLVNHKFKYPGMLVWNDVTITLVDVGNKAEEIITTLKLAGYGAGASCGSGISKGAFSAMGDFRIQLIKPNGSVAKQWRLDNWFYRSVRFGDLSYESDEFVTIELTLGYDFAELETGPQPEEVATKVATEKNEPEPESQPGTEELKF